MKKQLLSSFFPGKRWHRAFGKPPLVKEILHNFSAESVEKQGLPPGESPFAP